MRCVSSSDTARWVDSGRLALGDTAKWAKSGAWQDTTRWDGCGVGPVAWYISITHLPECICTIIGPIIVTSP